MQLACQPPPLHLCARHPTLARHCTAVHAQPTGRLHPITWVINLAQRPEAQPCLAVFQSGAVCLFLCQPSAASFRAPPLSGWAQEQKGTLPTHAYRHQAHYFSYTCACNSILCVRCPPHMYGGLSHCQPNTSQPPPCMPSAWLHRMDVRAPNLVPPLPPNPRRSLRASTST